MRKRVLIIPDAVMSDASGSVVTQVVRDHLVAMGHTVGVFSTDILEDNQEGNVYYYYSLKYDGTTNFHPKSHLVQCCKVYDSFSPDVVLTLGSITNKPVCYVEEALRRGYIVSLFIFMQDFFCSKIYANDENGPCTKCLDNGLCTAYKNTCGVRSSQGVFRLTQRLITRKLWKRTMAKVNHVATTTQEQMSFYERFGVAKSRIETLYLPFASNKLDGLKSTRGDYFIGIAQDRIEKGFHLIPEILKYAKVKVVLAYSSEEKAAKVRSREPLKPYIESGQLEIIASSWKDCLGNLIANSCGVIIPSIWPTTTEYGWLEAMALSKPVCCFDISVHHEFIENGVNGFVSPLGDFPAFAHNMDALCGLCEADYDTIARGSRLLFERLTDEETLNEQLTKLLS